nr:hypothetical protein [Lachnospiraceae bacterium]
MDIKIREWKIEDKSELAENLNNMNILNNLRDGLPYPYTEADAEEFIRAMLSADCSVYSYYSDFLPAPIYLRFSIPVFLYPFLFPSL